MVGLLTVIGAAAQIIPLLSRSAKGEAPYRTPPLVSQLETEFSELVNALCPLPKDRAVVFIDDLDRCTALGVSETFRALAVLLNNKVNATIVLAIDRDRVAAALAAEGEKMASFHLDEHHHHENGGEQANGNDCQHAVRLGHRFLEKFIEVTMRLPAFSEEFSNTLMQRKLSGAIQDNSLHGYEFRLADKTIKLLYLHTELVRKLLSGNPRRLKLWRSEVYLSLLTLDALNILSSIDTVVKGDKRITLGQVARFQALLIACPQFIRDLHRHHNLLKWITAYGIARDQWPTSWKLGWMDEARWGFAECRYWCKRIDNDELMEKLLSSGETATSSSDGGERPLMIELDVALLLEMQERGKIIQKPDAAPPPAGPADEPPAPSSPPSSKPLDDDIPVETESAKDTSHDEALSQDPPPTDVPPKQLADDDVDIKAVDEIPSFYRDEHRAAEAALERAVSRHGEMSEPHAEALNRMQSVLRSEGKFEKAKELCEQALTIRTELLGEEHIDVATSLNNLGSILRDLGELDVARQYLERALGICRKKFGEGHQSTLFSQARLVQIDTDTDAAKVEIERILPALIKRVPWKSRYPVVIGRMLREVGGDPVAIVRSQDGDKAAAGYAKILDSKLYPS